MTARCVDVIQNIFCQECREKLVLSRTQGVQLEGRVAVFLVYSPLDYVGRLLLVKLA